MAALSLKQVSRVYRGGVRAVNHLSLDVVDGELLVLVGPSGCGKTTTLRLVAGLEDVSEGEIRIDERVVNRLKPYERNVAMVFQHPVLYPHLTVQENIAFGLRQHERRIRAHSKDATSIVERVVEVARLLGIEQLLGRMPRQLSGGERQRVALGRSIVRRPDVFLLDEPLSGLDASLRLEMRRLLANLHQRLAITTLYVTHDQAEALTLGSRIAVMKEGAVEQIGTPQEVYREPCNQFVAGFIGSPPMSFLVGELTKSNSTWRLKGNFGDVAVAEAVAQRVATREARSIALGIRPEHVRLVTENDLQATDSIPAVVLRTELLGETQAVDLRIGGDNQQHQIADGCVIIRMGTSRQLARGDGVRVMFDWEHASWFDPASGRNVLAV